MEARGIIDRNLKRSVRVRLLRTAVFSMGLGIALSISMNAPAVSETAFMSLLISPSPAANGMGEICGGIADNSPLAIMKNPASLGMFGRNNVFGSEYYPNKVQWRPSPVPGMNVDAKSTAFCLALRPIRGIHISLGIGIYGSRFNLGQTAQLDTGMSASTGGFAPYEQVNGTAVSVTFEHIAIVSLGYTFKSLQSNPEPGMLFRSRTHDFGMAVQIPVFRLLRRSREFDPMEGPENFEPFLDPGFYFCRANIDGHAPAAGTGRTGPLPVNVSIGVHVNAGLRTRIGWRAYTLISLKWAHEMSDLLVRENQDGSWGTASGLGDIDFFGQVIRGKSNPRAISKRGLEFGLLDIYFYRTGKLEEPAAGLSYGTDGYGIDFLQPVKLLAAALDYEDSRLFRFLSNFTFEKHFSRIIPDRGSAPGGIRFSSVVIRLGNQALR